MRRLLSGLAFATLLAVTVGTVAGVMHAQSNSRLFATLAANMATGLSTPITCTANGTGCSLDVSVAGGSGLFADGTAGAPGIAFASEPSLGFSRRTAGIVAFNSGGGGAVDLTSTGVSVWSAAGYGWYSGALGTTADLSLQRGAAGRLVIQNTAGAIGVSLKVDALPTVASGFGTSPAVTAGSTPFAGSVNVGTGTPGTGGVLNFAGTAFPSTPFVMCQNQTTLMLVRCTATTTQLTIAAVAFTASDVVSWTAIGPKS